MKLRDYLISSPCTAVCKLDPTDVCIGCGRHIREIRDWPALTREQKLDILAQARSRMNLVKGESS